MIFKKIEVFNSFSQRVTTESVQINEFLGLGALCLCVFFMDMFGKKDDKDNKKDDKETKGGGGKGITASTTTSSNKGGNTGGDEGSNFLSLAALFNKQKEKGETISDEDQKDYDMMCTSMYDEDGNTLAPEQQQGALKSNFKKDDGSFDEDAFKKFQERQTKKYNDAENDGSLSKVEDEMGKITPEEQKKARDDAKSHSATVHETNKAIEDEIKKAQEQAEKDKETYKNDLSDERIKQRTEERVRAIEKEADDMAVKATEEFDKHKEKHSKDWGEDGVGGEKTAKINELRNKLEAGNIGNDDKYKWEAELNSLENEKKAADAELKKVCDVRDTARQNSQDMKTNAKAQADKDVAEQNKEIQSKIDNSEEGLKKSIEKIKSPEHQKEIRTGIEAKKKTSKEPEKETAKGPEKETAKKEEYKKMLKKAGKTDEEITKIMNDIGDEKGEDLDAAIDASAEENHIEIDDSEEAPKEEDGTEEEDDGKGGKSKTKFRKIKKKIGKGVKIERWSPSKNEWQSATKDEYAEWKKRQKKPGGDTHEGLSSFVRNMLMD